MDANPDLRRCVRSLATVPAALAPPVLDDRLRRLRAGAIEAVERPGREGPVEHRAVRGELGLEVVEDTLGQAAGVPRASSRHARSRSPGRTSPCSTPPKGTAGQGEIRAALAAVNLDADGLYHAVRARPQPTIDMETIERYLGADGLVRRGDGLCAMPDETRAASSPTSPNAAAPTPVGVSEAVAPPPWHGRTVPGRRDHPCRKSRRS